MNNFLKLAYEAGAQQALTERGLTKEAMAQAMGRTMGVPISRVAKTTSEGIPAMASEIANWKRIQEGIKQHGVGRIPLYESAGAHGRILQESRRIRNASRRAGFDPSVKGHLAEVAELNAVNPEAARRYVERLRDRGVL